MPTNLYAILGLKKNASAASIRKAYRKLAFELHPDRNSSDEAAARFKEVQNAWDVLGDPERRKRYDETGDCGLKADNSLGPILAQLSWAMSAVINTFLSNDIDPKSENMVEHMRMAMAQKREELTKNMLVVQKGTNALRDILDRFTTREEGENHLVSVTRSHLATNEENMSKIEKDIANLDASIAFLKQFGFVWDSSRMQIWMNASSATEGTGWCGGQ